MPCVFVHAEHSGKTQRAAPCLEAVTPGCEWVLAGDGIATRKLDGTACAIIEGHLFARYDAKHGKTPPVGAMPCDPAPDPVTGHWPHWVEVKDQPEFKWHREAWASMRRLAIGPETDGTFELIGPAINSNKERISGVHRLIRHGSAVLDDAPRTHSGLKEYLSQLDAEGIVFHHPDGRMAKIRRADFCLPWPRGIDSMTPG